jgi:hypothetical protein
VPVPTSTTAAAVTGRLQQATALPTALSFLVNFRSRDPAYLLPVLDTVCTSIPTVTPDSTPQEMMGGERVFADGLHEVGLNERGGIGVGQGDLNGWCRVSRGPSTEALSFLCSGMIAGQNHLERDDSIERQVLRLVDDAHAATT